MWDGENHEFLNAIRMRHSREPSHGGSPVVANDVRCVDTERIKNTDRVAHRILQRIRADSFWAIGAPEAPQVRRDCAEAVIDQERDLVAPKIRGVRPSVEQELGLTAAVILT